MCFCELNDDDDGDDEMTTLLYLALVQLQAAKIQALYVMAIDMRYSNET